MDYPYKIGSSGFKPFYRLIRVKKKKENRQRKFSLLKQDLLLFQCFQCSIVIGFINNFGYLFGINYFAIFVNNHYCS